jgi:hypothetical protein
MFTACDSEKRAFLLALGPAQCRAHCFLAALGVLESPPAEVWRRAGEAPLVELFGPEWELLALLQEAGGEPTEDVLRRLHLCLLWRYYRGPRVAEWFARPGADERLIDYVAERLACDLRRPAQVDAELRGVYHALWDAIVYAPCGGSPAGVPLYH